MDADTRKLIEEAAEEGAKRALERLGLHDDDAPRDVLELRSLLDSYRAVKRGVMQTIGKAIAITVLLALAWGAGTGKLKFW